MRGGVMLALARSPIIRCGKGVPRKRLAAGLPRQTIASLYGNGPGQVPLHIAPEDAILSGGNVVSIPNRGGAGAYFEATAKGTAPVVGSGNLARMASAGGYLALANPVETVGVHLFTIIASDRTSNLQVIGANRGSGAGQQTGVVWYPGVPNLILRRWNGSAFEATETRTTTITANPTLIETEMVGGVVKVWINGVERINVSQPAWTSYPMEFFGRGYAEGAGFIGAFGDVVSLATDGTHTRQIETIRRELAAKHGIALPWVPDVLGARLIWEASAHQAPVVEAGLTTLHAFRGTMSRRAIDTAPASQAVWEADYGDGKPALAMTAAQRLVSTTLPTTPDMLSWTYLFLVRADGTPENAANAVLSVGDFSTNTQSFQIDAASSPAFRARFNSSAGLPTITPTADSKGVWMFGEVIADAAAQTLTYRLNGAEMSVSPYTLTTPYQMNTAKLGINRGNNVHPLTTRYSADMLVQDMTAAERAEAIAYLKARWGARMP